MTLSSVILKACSDKIVAKFINWEGGGGGVDASLFSLKRLKSFENEKNFPLLGN